MSRKYSRRNYSEALEKIIPEVYREEDLKLVQEQEDLLSKLLFADMDMVIRFEPLCRLTHIFATETQYSSLNLGPWNQVDYRERLAYTNPGDLWSGWAEGLVKYFIPQNKLTHIEPKKFNIDILVPLGYDMGDYSTSAEFHSFIENTLMPQLLIGEGNINVAAPTDLVASTKGAFGETYVESLKYLLTSLGLFALFNYNQDASYPTNPPHPYCSKVWELTADIFTEKLYAKNEPVTVGDATRLLKELGFAFTGFFPYIYTDEFDVDEESTYLSGTQSLDKVLTWNSVLYGLHNQESSDTFVKEFYENYLLNKTQDPFFSTQGPLKKFITAVGFLMGDLDNQILSLNTLNSIEKCPAEYLPYLADHIGWKFYTSNVDSWRRQLRDARSLLQKKGTKQGLIDLLRSILPATEIDFDTAFSEYYESYIPNLIYYLLKTESDELASPETWNETKAHSFAGGEYDYYNHDNNIRFVVDHILLEAVHHFSDLFNIKGYAFQPDHPKFVFNYRGRDFNMPPFEDERFYKDCDVTYDLIAFFKEKLLCLGVEDYLCDAFEAYILNNTIEGYQDEKLYNNGFLFLTKELNQAPNYDRIISDLESKLYDYLPMWNGKSSHFTLEVSSGNFDDEFFVQTAYTTEDFFESLRAINDFVPAKSIPRVDVSLRHGDLNAPFTATYPRISYAFLDTPNPSGAMASFELSTLNMRDPSLGLIGSAIDPTYVYDSRGTNDYSGLPVFKRDRLGFGRQTSNAAWEDTSTVYNVSGPYDEVAPRTATRRRDLQKTTSKGQLYRRDGFNPPTFLNTTTLGTGSTVSGIAEYVPLGLIPSSMKFTPVPDHLNVPEVYDECQTTASNDVFNGIRSKHTFKVRGAIDKYNPPADEAYMNNLVYKYRDNLDDIYKLIYRLKDEELATQAKLTLEHNIHLVNNLNWADEFTSLKNKLWNELDYSIEDDFHKMKMDFYKRLPNEFNKTFHYLYLNDYVKQGKGLVSTATLDDVVYGGASLISHIYGPTFFNALNKLDGSSVGTVRASEDIDNRTVFDRSSIILNNKIQSIDQDYEFEIRFCDTELSSNYFQVGVAPEEYSPHFISGVDIIGWRNSKENKMFVYDLSTDEGFLPEKALLLDGNFIGFKAKEYMPRFRYSLNYKEDGYPENFLRPEHNFSVELSSIFLNEDSFKADARSAYIWIHTEEETDSYGNTVFWNYMPDGTWQLLNTSAVKGGTGIANVKQNLCHKFTHPAKDILDTADVRSCYIDNVNREVLYSLTSDDLVVNKVEFNTLNRKIKIPLSYYQYKQQAHRQDQKYVIEVFPELSNDDRQFWAFKGIRCVDETMRKRISFTQNYTIPDYSLSKTNTDKLVELFYSDGSPVEIGTKVYITRDGDILKDGDKITISVSVGGKRVLYEKAFVGFIEYPAATAGNNQETYERRFEGYAEVNGYTQYDILKGEITVEGDSRIKEYNGIQDAALLNFSSSDMIPAVPRRATVLTRNPGGGCLYFSKELYTTVTSLDAFDVSASSEVSTNSYSTPNNIIYTSATTLSCNDINYMSPKEVGNSYIKNNIGGETLYNTGQIQYNPENPYYYLSHSASCAGQLQLDDNTWGYIDSYSTSAGSFVQDPYDTQPVYANTYLKDFYIEQSKKEKYENYFLEEKENLVFYEPSQTEGKNNYAIAACVFKETADTPPIVEFSLGMGGFSPHHQNQRLYGVQYTPSQHSYNGLEYWTEVVDRLNYIADVDSIYEGASYIVDSQVFSPFKVGYPGQDLATWLVEINEPPGYIKPIEFRGSDDFDGGRIGVYNLTDGWKLMFMAVNCDALEEYSDTELDPIYQRYKNYVKDSLSTPVKISLGMFRRASWEPAEGSVEVSYLSLFSEELEPGYQFPLSYFTEKIDQISNISPTVYGTELGTYITKDIEYKSEMSPQNLLSTFRFYNDISDDIQSRDSSNTEGYHGPNGGGRSNYRIHPAEFANITDFISTGKITTLNITN